MTHNFHCPYCLHPFHTRLYLQLHFDMGCPERPISQQLSEAEFQALLNRAREIDVAAGREARNEQR